MPVDTSVVHPKNYEDKVRNVHRRKEGGGNHFQSIYPMNNSKISNFLTRQK